jgi:hypothetical protein
MRILTIAVQTALVFLAVSLLNATAAVANPTGKEPNRALAAHGTIAAAKGMVPGLYELCDESEKFVALTYERRDTPVKFSDRQISKAYGQLWQARRHADHLILMGEPAGVDLSKKVDQLYRQVGKFGTAYRSTPGGQKWNAKARKELDRKRPGLMRFLQQADAAIDQGKLEIVDRQLEAKGVELHEKVAFFTAAEVNKYIKELMAVLSKNDSLLKAKRRKEYMARATEVMNQQIVAATQFPAEATRIRDEIAATGTATLGENQSGGAPEAFAHVATLWGHASAGLGRATAIQWAFTSQAETQLQPSPAKLKEVAIQSLASIVEAAAASTPPDQVQTTYSELLKQISQVERRSGMFSQDLSKTCQPALRKLAAKDPALQARIDTYQRATSEVLRWRQEYASQQSKNLSVRFPAATTLLTSKSEITSHNRPNFAGPPSGETYVAPISFGSPANWMVYEASTRLVGEPISEDLLIRLTPTSRTAVVPYQANHYGNVSVPLPTDEEVNDLLNALVVDDTHGPLTIDSADAVSSAELHDYASVSGLIQSVHLESLVTRFITLPDVAYTLTPLGRKPPIDTSIQPLQQTCWRLDIKPIWARHKYFTTRGTSSAQ